MILTREMASDVALIGALHATGKMTNEQFISVLNGDMSMEDIMAACDVPAGDAEAVRLASDLLHEKRITKADYLTVLDGDHSPLERFLTQAAPGQPVPKDMEPEEPPKPPPET